MTRCATTRRTKSPRSKTGSRAPIPPRAGLGDAAYARRPMIRPAASSTTPATPATTPCFMCTRATPASWPWKKPGSESAGTTKYTTAITSKAMPSKMKMAFIAEHPEIEAGRTEHKCRSFSRKRESGGRTEREGADTGAGRLAQSSGPRDRDRQQIKSRGRTNAGDHHQDRRRHPPSLRCFGLHLLVFRFRPLGRRSRRDARGIVGEFLPVGDHLEHHAPADIGADQHVGGGELLTHQPRTFLDGFRQHI